MQKYEKYNFTAWLMHSSCWSAIIYLVKDLIATNLAYAVSRLLEATEVLGRGNLTRATPARVLLLAVLVSTQHDRCCIVSADRRCFDGFQVLIYRSTLLYLCTEMHEMYYIKLHTRVKTWKNILFTANHANELNI